MASLLSLIGAMPTRTLAPGEILIVQGESGGDLYVLESGRLAVERDGVNIAAIDQPGTAVGEMSVLLGAQHSATVRAETETRLRVIRDAARYLEQEPALTFQLATLVAGRLDATSALLVNLSRQAKPSERSLVDRLLAVVLGS